VTGWQRRPRRIGCDGHTLGRARTAGAALVAALFLMPLLLMIVGSLRPVGAPPARSIDVPWPPSIGSYGSLTEHTDVVRYAVNSIIVAIVVVPAAVVLASWAGFAMATLSRRLSATLVGISAAAAMVPTTALLVGRFATFRSLGLIDTFWPFVASSLIGVSPVNALLFAWAFHRIPRELFDACRLEGMSPLGAWRSVGMPLVRPVTVVVAALAFIATWGNVLDPLIYLHDERRYTLPLGLRTLSELDPPNAPIMLAGAVVATIPAVIAIAAAQRALRGSVQGG
jgi:multiple sugar transport system permease protein